MSSTSYSFMTHRLPHFTLAWYTFPMSTGGLALVLMNNAMELQELKYIGRVLFFCNLALVFGVTAMQVLRFASGAASVVGVLKHPLESVFVGPAILAFATVVNGSATVVGRDGGETKSTMMLVFFWTYTCVALVQSFVSYFFLWNEGKQKLSNMMPGWVLPIFPSMLVGTVANAVIPTQPPARAFELAIAGSCFQGLGFAFSCFMYAILFMRLMTVGLPHVNHRPGLFMCAGPPSFTALAIIGMARESSRFLPEQGIANIPRDQVATLLVLIAITGAIFLWLLAAWFFCFALVSIVIGTIQHPSHMTFVLAWWAFIFPNVGFCIATKSIADALDSQPIRNLATVLTIFLMIAWPLVFFFHLEGYFSRKIVWHGKDEDRDLDAPPGVDASHGDQDSQKDVAASPLKYSVHLHEDNEKLGRLKTSHDDSPTKQEWQSHCIDICCETPSQGCCRHHGRHHDGYGADIKKTKHHRRESLRLRRTSGIIIDGSNPPRGGGRGALRFDEKIDGTLPHRYVEPHDATIAIRYNPRLHRPREVGQASWSDSDNPYPSNGSSGPNSGEATRVGSPETSPHLSSSEIHQVSDVDPYYEEIDLSVRPS